MTKEEYEAKYHANMKFSGTGFETTCHVPCPFCAEPDFLVHRVIGTEEAYTKGAVCPACGAGFRGIFQHDASGVTMEIVQTCGPDAPDFMPVIRRVES